MNPPDAYEPLGQPPRRHLTAKGRMLVAAAN